MAHITKKRLLSSLLQRRHSVSALSRLYAQDVKHSKISDEHNPFTFEKILSDANKQRIQSRLAVVKPARTKTHVEMNSNPGKAAVLVPLCTINNEPSLLLTLRSTKLANYRGQVSFPGGNVEASDPDVQFTALRETEEELGIHPSAFDIWGHMNALPTSSGKEKKMVYPIIAKTGELDLSTLKLNDDEVEEVFAVSLRHLCNPDNIRTTRFRSKHSYTVPVYLGSAHRIWGLTAVIIHMLLSIVVPDIYTFELRHQQSKRF